MDAKRAVEVLELMVEGLSITDFHYADLTEKDAADAIAALKAQGEPALWLVRWQDSRIEEDFEQITYTEAEAIERAEDAAQHSFQPPTITPLYTAPQPIQPAMRPKRLEWNSRDDVWFASPMAWVDDYIIYEQDGLWELDGISSHDSLDEAKAAAQADFERQVMSCLEPGVSYEAK